VTQLQVATDLQLAKHDAEVLPHVETVAQGKHKDNGYVVAGRHSRIPTISSCCSNYMAAHASGSSKAKKSKYANNVGARCLHEPQPKIMHATLKTQTFSRVTERIGMVGK
jgi:hypothetical protein